MMGFCHDTSVLPAVCVRHKGVGKLVLTHVGVGIRLLGGAQQGETHLIAVSAEAIFAVRQQCYAEAVFR